MINQGHNALLIVIEGPVQSSFFPKYGVTVTMTGHQVYQISRNCDQTEHDQLPPVC